MSKIASSSALVPATIYIYFESTEHIIHQLYINIAEGIADNIFKGYGSDMNVWQGFYLAWKNLYRYLVDHPDVYSFQEQYTRSPYFNRVAKKDADLPYLPLRKFFEAGMEGNVLRKMPLDIAQAHFVGPVTIVAGKVISGRGEISSALIDLAIENTWRSLKK
jgi:hypothetical protein